MGKVFIGGGKPDMAAPVKSDTGGSSGTGIAAGELAVGNSVFLKENGVLVEYLIVNQGIPSDSSLYDSSCDGTWLLRKDVYDNRVWHSSNHSSYKASTIHTFLTGEFLALFYENVQNAIVQAKIPYVNGTGQGGSVASGSNGLSTKIFLLSGFEVGFTTDPEQALPVDGACLSYFNDASDATRIAYLDETANNWWLRSPETERISNACYVRYDGIYGHGYCASFSYGVRPALILPSNALFDSNTMEFLGVA